MLEKWAHPAIFQEALSLLLKEPGREEKSRWRCDARAEHTTWTFASDQATLFLAQWF
jgi:hypothetical protein